MSASSSHRIASDRQIGVIGLGVTGCSVIRHLDRQGISCVALDTRQNPPGLDALRDQFSHLPVQLGPLQKEVLEGFSELVVSPGISINDAPLSELNTDQVTLIGDIELFAREVKAPVIAITGSNGKSTVTTLVGKLLEKAGMDVGVGGNLGTPALDLLAKNHQIYVLELSSFQLETTVSLAPRTATMLNLSQDHLDRYPDMLTYHRAKQRIYRHAQQVIFNRDDVLTQPLRGGEMKPIKFGLSDPDLGHYGVRHQRGVEYLAFGMRNLLPVSELAMKGKHNVANALAALALVRSFELDEALQFDVLRTFQGLPHRCQTVFEEAGVAWIDDSKATNVGAAATAIEGLGNGKNIVWIAGGQAKGQDFVPLRVPLERHVKLAILIGEDASKVEADLRGACDMIFATSMAAAVDMARSIARSGDRVLLSPACASFDMFKGYADRGQVFAKHARGEL